MRRHYEQIQGAQLVAQHLNWDKGAELDGIADTQFLYSAAKLSSWTTGTRRLATSPGG